MGDDGGEADDQLTIHSDQADAALSHTTAGSDATDEVASVTAATGYENTHEQNWRQQHDAAAAAAGATPLPQYDAKVADAEAQQTTDDGAALVAEAGSVTADEVTSNDGLETAINALAESIAGAATAETTTLAPEEAQQAGQTASDVALGIGADAAAQAGFLGTAAGAVAANELSTVQAATAYDNGVAGANETYADAAAQAAAALYKSDHSATALAQYNATLASAATAQQASIKAANVTRVAALGQAEIAEATALGADQQTFAAAEGSAETSTTASLAGDATTLAADESSWASGAATEFLSYESALAADQSAYAYGLATASTAEADHQADADRTQSEGQADAALQQGQRSLTLCTGKD
ncbi:MAG TPA: hypothetical protein VGN42_17025, partial [Pirellulales bacterium]|nr:hypothetical protein [Pirellulales bacterium]